MSKSKGRTGARGRANIAPPPTPEEVAAAEKLVRQCQGHLLELSAGHPSVKIWRARLRQAQAVVARAAGYQDG